MGLMGDHSSALPHRLAALLAATERLSRARSLKDVIEIVRAAARGITGAQGISFVTCEGDDCVCVAEDAVGPLWAGQRFRMDSCVSGWVMNHRKPAIIDDVYADPRVPHDAYRPTFVKSMAMMPVVNGSNTAAIGAYWSETGGADEESLELLQVLARHVGAAIGNVDLQRSLQVLNEVGAMVASGGDLALTVQKITDAGVELSGAEFGAFFYNLIDEKGESYTLYSLSGAPREAFSHLSMPRNTAIFAPTFNGEGVLRSDNIKLDPRYGQNIPRQGMPDGHLPVSSYLAVPVISRSGEVHGGLFFGHHREAQFTDQHEEAMLAIAGHAAIAIDNARLSAEQCNADAALKELNVTLERRVEERAREIQRAQAKLEESERRFHSLVQGVTDYAIYGLDPSGIITDWNAGAERIKGYTRDEIIGRHLETFYTEADRAAGMPARTLEIATHMGKCEAEGLRVRKDGSEFWASVVVDALHDEQGNLIGFAKITRDLTEKRAVEEQLRQSQKMEAVGQLTGGIAHDFNNLLTIITGSVDIASRALDSTEGLPRAKRALGNAMKGAERAAALTQRLLAFSRRQPLAPKPLDVDKVVLGLADLLKRSLGELVQLEIVTTPGLWSVEADPNEFESALVNLAVNARDAMEGGGTLTIETANARLDVSYSASHAEVPPGNYVVVAVSDTGTGMKKEVLARAFEPFFTTKEVGKGTGLGLSQIYGFVKQSGGHVNIYSEEGRGTTVKIYLPRFTGQDHPGFTEDAPLDAEPSIAGETILVVEDDEEVRSYSVEVLRELGYNVLEAADGAAALALLEAYTGPLDLLFTDVVMPGISGKELSDRVRRIRSGVQTLFTSGYTGNAIVHAGRLDPGVELLTKPFTIQELSQKVQDLLDAQKGHRLLIAESDATIRLLAADGLTTAGYRVDTAANASELIGKLRAAQGRYEAVLVDAALPGKQLESLLLEMKSLHQQLHLVVTHSPEGRVPIDVDWVTKLQKPYSTQDVARLLTGISRFAPAPPR